MANKSTPGVYIEEISTLPPSVTEVATAIPAFIGYTEKGVDKVERINTLLEYEDVYGTAPLKSYTVKTRTLEDKQTNRKWKEIVKITPDSAKDKFRMHYCMRHYFQNGGGACYIISIGSYKDKAGKEVTPEKEHFKLGLDKLEQEDEPTLILFPDAVEVDGYYTVCQLALAQCNKLGDRFAILDVYPTLKPGKIGDDVKKFREGVGQDYLKYGAAYCPFLETTLTYKCEDNEISIIEEVGESTETGGAHRCKGTFGGIDVIWEGSASEKPKVEITEGNAQEDVSFAVVPSPPKLTVTNVGGKDADDIFDAWEAWAGHSGNDKNGFEIAKPEPDTEEPATVTDGEVELQQAPPESESDSKRTLKSIRSTETDLYNLIKRELTEQRVTLPPSAAVAGIYARVDRDRGVWKAPANVGVMGVIGPVSKFSNEDQDLLNEDSTGGGKSINAIRSFFGKGTLVWGARTLAGNDNEWKYVSVRRLFNMIEESAKKATAFAVFEPNDATTWLKVKGMLESYLYGLWERGALQGPTPDAAYFVNVGLGKTMRSDDVLNGKMIVELGIAAVRPAEFIILRFTHKLAEG